VLVGTEGVPGVLMGLLLLRWYKERAA
jgi:hypothetical protein